MKARILSIAVLALGLAACATNDYGRRNHGRDGYTYDTRCATCGTVERIEVAQAPAPRGAGVGLAGGGLVAAALAGSSDDAGTDSRGRSRFSITVRVDDGRRVVLEQRALAGLREGARVVLRGGRAELM